MLRHVELQIVGPWVARSKWYYIKQGASRNYNQTYLSWRNKRRKDFYFWKCPICYICQSVSWRNYIEYTSSVHPRQDTSRPTSWRTQITYFSGASVLSPEQRASTSMNMVPMRVRWGQTWYSSNMFAELDFIPMSASISCERQKSRLHLEVSWSILLATTKMMRR